jgi:hypothetical protein
MTDSGSEESIALLTGTGHGPSHQQLSALHRLALEEGRTEDARHYDRMMSLTCQADTGQQLPSWVAGGIVAVVSIVLFLGWPHLFGA